MACSYKKMLQLLWVLHRPLRVRALTMLNIPSHQRLEKRLIPFNHNKHELKELQMNVYDILEG